MLWVQNIALFAILAACLLLQRFLPLSFRLKIDAILFLIFSAACMLFGTESELTGAAFLYLFAFSWENKKAVIGFLAGAAVLIVVKFEISGYTNSELLKYLIGYLFIISHMFSLTWPKKQDIIQPMTVIDFYPSDKAERELWEAIIYHIRHGFKVRSIAIASSSWKCKKKKLTADEIQNRIDLMREKMNASDKAQLIEKLYQAGILKLKKAE